MTVFGAYSRYYNLLYKDKDFSGEADYIHGLIGKLHPGAESILDLGCGTGRHDLLLAQKGYAVAGVDRSGEMLAVANSQLSALNSQPPCLSFHQGDIRTVRLGATFDVVISLFHVMSYQVTNDDLKQAFATARTHLKPDGIFIFDCWYGPAVLSDPPAVRVKRFADDDVEIVRIAEPVMHHNENTVDVNYQVFVTEKAGGKTETLCETHRMRYLFRPEILDLFADNGIRAVYAGEWLTGRELGRDTWGACFLGAV